MRSHTLEIEVALFFEISETSEAKVGHHPELLSAVKSICLESYNRIGMIMNAVDFRIGQTIKVVPEMPNTIQQPDPFHPTSFDPPLN